ncbi:MAG: hypothetical protein WED13_08455, partial [Methyloceanibacter sp.]
PGQFGSRLDQFVRDNDYGFLSYINADRAFIKQLDMPFRAVHVIRDPRDVVVSAYFSHLHSHPTSGWPELIDFRGKLTSLSTKEGLLAEFEFITDWRDPKQTLAIEGASKAARYNNQLWGRALGKKSCSPSIL